MMNRVKEVLEQNAAEPSAGSFFVVRTRRCTWYVSITMARHIERCLDERWWARWVTFVDITGTRVRLRARQIDYICECTAEQRAAWRKLQRLLDQEAEAE